MREILASIREVARLQGLNIGPRVDVDTSKAHDLNVVLREVHRALERFGTQASHAGPPPRPAHSVDEVHAMPDWQKAAERFSRGASIEGIR